MITNFCYKLLHFLGVHPHYPLGKLRLTFNATVMLCLSLLICVNLYEKKIEAIDAIESLSIFILSFIKYFTFLFGKNRARQLLITKDLFWKADVEDDVVKSAKNHTERVDKFYKVALGIGISSFVIKLFALNEMSMFNCYKPPQIPFPIFFLWELYVLVVISTAFVCSNILTCFLITVVVVQFRVLNLNMKTLNLSSIGNSTELDTCRRRLRKKIKYHQFLIGYVQDLKNLLSTPIALFLAFGVILICMETYIISMNKGNVAACGRPVVVVSVLVLEFISVYGMPAQLLMDESQALGDAVYYDLEWYVPNAVPLRKDLWFMIMRCQKSVRLRAGGYHVVNNQTVIVVLKTAYTFYTFLQTM